MQSTWRTKAAGGLALAHGYDTAFWWTAGIFAGARTTATAGRSETSGGGPRPGLGGGKICQKIPELAASASTGALRTC